MFSKIFKNLNEVLNLKNTDKKIATRTNKERAPQETLSHLHSFEWFHLMISFTD